MKNLFGVGIAFDIGNQIHYKEFDAQIQKENIATIIENIFPFIFHQLDFWGNFCQVQQKQSK